MTQIFILILGICTFFLIKYLYEQGKMHIKKDEIQKKCNLDHELNKQAEKKLGLRTLGYQGNPEINMWLDKILIDGIISGIKSCENSQYHLNIEFNNGVVCDFWNENKYYGWLHQGKIILPENKEEVLSYKEAQPQPYTMLKLKLAIEKFKVSTTPYIPSGVVVNKK